MRSLLLIALLATGCVAKKGKNPEEALPDRSHRVDGQEPHGVLEAAASDDDPSMRARALDLLLRTTPTPGGGQWADRALFDPDPWVQRRGVDALASRMAERESVARLEAYVKRDGAPYPRSRAAMELAKAGHTGTADVLSRAWRDEPETWRAAPLMLAALTMGDDEALAPLQQALAGADLGLEVDFVLDVGASGRTELLDAVRSGQELVEDELLLPFAAARVALGDSAGEGELRKALSADDPFVRLEALDYLSRMQHPTADALLERAASQRDTEVRTYARLALAARRADDAPFVEAAASEDRDIRVLAVRFATESAQGTLATRRTIKTARRVVKGALLDEDPTVRVQAIQSAASLGMETEAPALVANLGDEYPSVRVEAAGAMLLLARDEAPL